MDGSNEHVTINTEYGVLYPNGTIDWKTTAWFGSIETPDQRASFQHQYDLRMRDMGAVAADLQFVTRTMVHACTPYTVIIDEVPAPPAEDPAPPIEDPAPPAEIPEPPIEDPAPPVDDVPAAAPDEGDAPPTDGDVVEEESPVDNGEGSEPDANPPATDDEGEHEHGG